MSEKKHPGGRPTRYSEQWHPKLVKALSESGKTDEEMSVEMGIAVSTFYKWKKEKPEFSEAIKEGKKGPDDMVEAALFQRALGYEHPEEKITVHAETGYVTRVQTIKKYPPSEVAAIFWLKNRRPDRWRDKQEIEASGEIHIHMDVDPNAVV